jgi:hypothetical protein
MLISDKALALSTALDKTVDLLGNMIQGLHYDPTTYAILITELERLYGGADQEIETVLSRQAKLSAEGLESTF